MEVTLLLLLSIPIVIIQYYRTDHETKSEKDTRKHAEGIRLVRTKRYELGAAFFDEVIKESPTCAVAYAFRGICNYHLGNLYSAIFDCNYATSIDGALPEAYLMKGKALYQLEEYKSAFLEFDKAVWHFKNNSEAFRWRGLARLQIEEITQAKADFRKAIDLGDEDAVHDLQKLMLGQNGWISSSSVE